MTQGIPYLKEIKVSISYMNNSVVKVKSIRKNLLPLCSFIGKD